MAIGCSCTLDSLMLVRPFSLPNCHILTKYPVETKKVAFENWIADGMVEPPVSGSHRLSLGCKSQSWLHNN